MGLHLHEMRDTDKHFIIDPVTRAITNANAAKNKLIQFDHNSEIFTFEIPQYVDGHDMNKCDKVEIHYINIDGKTKEQSKDLFNAKAAAKTDSDLVFNLEDGKLLFCWKISGNATKYAGSLNFLVCFSCLDDAGAITYKWHTDIFKGITISDGLSNTEAVAEQYSDVLEQWKKELENASGSGSGGGSYVVNIIDNGDDTFRTDKTFAQISEAIAAGKEAVCVFGTYHYQLVTCTDTKIVFSVSECEGVVSYKTLTLDNTNGDNEVIYKFDMPGYQYETDGNLQTEDITVVGAINEVNAKVNSVINNGTVISENTDYAEVGEWSDGNPDAEDRTGYFVSVDASEPGKTMVKATSTSDVRGVAIAQPAFSANASADKYDTEGNLLKQYDYVCFVGFAPVIDNGTCAVNGRCMPADDGTAVPSSNNMGYQVIERIDDTHVLVLVEPQADMMVRIKEDVSELSKNKADQTEVNKLKSDIANKESIGTAESKVSEHNTSIDAHGDIRLIIEGLENRLNAVANSEDVDLDQLEEIVTYIKSNRNLIDSITTSKVSVSDIIDNLTTNVSNKPLSAAQGVALKALIDGIKVPTKTSDLTNDSGYMAQPETAQIGQIFKVKSINEDGTLVLEAVDMPSGGGGAVDDVQINGTSIVENGVAKIPLASIKTAGTMKVSAVYSGFSISGAGFLLLSSSTISTLANRGNVGGAQLKIISSENFDDAVKLAMCDGKGAVWTDTERIAALLRMGCTVDDNGFVKWTAQEGT